jgi:type II secretory pathway pseudopilin PulG
VPTPGIPPQVGQRQPSIGVTGYHTVMGPDQQKQVMEQARQQVQAHHQVQAQQQAQAHARLEAQARVSNFGHNTPQGNKAVGIDAMGLKPPVTQSPRASPAGLNGSTVLSPAATNDPSMTGHSSPPLGGSGPVP